MKLQRLDIATVSKAVAIYLDLAYGGGVRPRRMPDLSLPADAHWEAVLGLFQQESQPDPAGRSSPRYFVQLGNRNYPFMKLVLQEHLVPGEYFFAVDSHDEMDIKPDYPDYEAWMAVRRFNRGLKRRIEAQFAAEGVCTSATLRDLGRSSSDEVAEPRHRILVVDDEEDLAQCVENVLRARGYAVVRADDGQAAIQRAKECQPDLILLDYELPEMDGLEVIAALRQDEQTRSIPVLLATAGRISLEDIEKADGFLAKPFPGELLCQMVDRLLSVRKT